MDVLEWRRHARQVCAGESRSVRLWVSSEAEGNSAVEGSRASDARIAEACRFSPVWSWFGSGSGGLGKPSLMTRVTNLTSEVAIFDASARSEGKARRPSSWV
jgi:hypothetical protein